MNDQKLKQTQAKVIAANIRANADRLAEVLPQLCFIAEAMAELKGVKDLQPSVLTLRRLMGLERNVIDRKHIFQVGEETFTRDEAEHVVWSFTNRDFRNDNVRAGGKREVLCVRPEGAGWVPLDQMTTEEVQRRLAGAIVVRNREAKK